MKIIERKHREAVDKLAAQKLLRAENNARRRLPPRGVLEGMRSGCSAPMPRLRALLPKVCSQLPRHRHHRN